MSPFAIKLKHAILNNMSAEAQLENRITIDSIIDNSSLQEIKEKVRHIPITLVIPPSPFLADERVFPFLGPLKVAAELERNGNPVEVLDLSGYKNFEDIARQYASGTQNRVFGITATTPQIPSAVLVSQTIRHQLPDAKIILGGPHVTLTHSAMIQDRKAKKLGRGSHAFQQLENLFDRLVVGDGEEAVFLSLDPDYQDQIVDAGSLRSPLYLQKGSLDNYAIPSRHLIDHNSYHYTIDGLRAFSVIGQLGCPFECGFCGGRDSQVFRVARTRSVEGIISEIEHVIIPSIESGDPYRAVMFYDDELNVSPGNLETLCQGLIDMQDKLGMEMRFRGFVKAELFTQEQADLMYKAGFRILLSGVESGSDKILSTMRKHTSREVNSRCMQYAHNSGLRFKALMSIGHPGENENTVLQSIEWVVNNLQPGDDVDWTIITQYPGSPYFDRSVYVPENDAWLYQVQNRKTGEISRLWSREVDYALDANYYKGVPGEYTAYVWTDYLAAQELVQIRDFAENITRTRLNLPPVEHLAALQYEHSMGQGIPEQILRSSNSNRPI